MSTDGMKRISIYPYSASGEPEISMKYGLNEVDDCDGDYVLYSDAQAEIDTLKEALETSEAMYQFKCDKLAEVTIAACKVLLLNQCELEGMDSGMPTPKEWREAFEQLNEVVNG